MKPLLLYSREDQAPLKHSRMRPISCLWVSCKVRAKQWAVVFIASLLFHEWDLLTVSGLGYVVLLNAEFSLRY